MINYINFKSFLCLNLNEGSSETGDYTSAELKKLSFKDGVKAALSNGRLNEEEAEILIAKSRENNNINTISESERNKLNDEIRRLNFAIENEDELNEKKDKIISDIRDTVEGGLIVNDIGIGLLEIKVGGKTYNIDVSDLIYNKYDNGNISLRSTSGLGYINLLIDKEKQELRYSENVGLSENNVSIFKLKEGNDSALEKISNYNYSITGNSIKLNLSEISKTNGGYTCTLNQSNMFAQNAIMDVIKLNFDKNGNVLNTTNPIYKVKQDGDNIIISKKEPK